MAETSSIEWTDATWNPVTGCAVVSPGCTNCYAMQLAGTRLRAHPSRAGLTRSSKAGPVWTGETRLNEEWLPQPIRWRRPRRIFVCAHGDLFAERVPDAWIDHVFAVMALAPHHTFQVLTKRSARMRAYCSDPRTERRIYELVCDLVILGSLDVVLIAPGINPDLAPPGTRVQLGTWPLQHVWLGVSAEDQVRADQRVPDLLETPAAIRFVSAEPLLGPIDFTNIRPADRYEVNAFTGFCFDQGMACERLDWVIVGGESGRGARPMHPEWVRAIRKQCSSAGVAFFFKQWGEWFPESFRLSIKEADGSVEPDVAWPDGTIAWGRSHERGGLGYRLDRVGKARAGRLLDGVEHSAMPGDG